MTSLGTAFSVSRRYASGGAVKPDRMKQVDGALGGNTGGVFKDKGGTEYYVKRAKSVDVAKNEKLASELYKAIGVPVADKQVTTWKGSPAIAGRMIKGKELKDFKKSQYAGIKELQCNFPADVWLGNYDAVGLHHDNIVVDEDGVAHRIDVGGSLTRRAKGGKKPWWGPKVIEFGAMLNPKVNRFANSVFNIKGDEIEAGRKEVAQRIADLPDDEIRSIVHEYGPGGKVEKDRLTEDLIARREQVADYYRLEKKYAKGGEVKDEGDGPADDTSFADLPHTPEGTPQITVTKPTEEPLPPEAPPSEEPIRPMQPGPELPSVLPQVTAVGKTLAEPYTQAVQTASRLVRGQVAPENIPMEVTGAMLGIMGPPGEKAAAQAATTTAAKILERDIANILHAQPHLPSAKTVQDMSHYYGTGYWDLRPEAVSSAKKLTGSLGTSEGGIYTGFPDKQNRYIKVANSLDHAKNEVLASKLYEAVGVPTAHLELTQVGGKPAVSSIAVPGQQLGHYVGQINGLKEHFPADAWLANWDSVGVGHENPLGNVIVDDYGNARRIDFGGALLYRGLGGEKGSKFTDHVGEILTLRDPAINPVSAKIFGDIGVGPDNETALRIALLSDKSIRDLVNFYGPGTQEQKTALADKLIARRSDLADKYGLIKTPSGGTPPPLSGLPTAEDWAEAEGKYKQIPFGKPAIVKGKLGSSATEAAPMSEEAMGLSPKVNLKPMQLNKAHSVNQLVNSLRAFNSVDLPLGKLMTTKQKENISNLLSAIPTKTLGDALKDMPPEEVANVKSWMTPNKLLVMDTLLKDTAKVPDLGAITETTSLPQIINSIKGMNPLMPEVPYHSYQNIPMILNHHDIADIYKAMQGLSIPQKSNVEKWLLPGKLSKLQDYQAVQSLKNQQAYHQDYLNSIHDIEWVLHRPEEAVKLSRDIHPDVARRFEEMAGFSLPNLIGSPSWKKKVESLGFNPELIPWKGGGYPGIESSLYPNKIHNPLTDTDKLTDPKERAFFMAHAPKIAKYWAGSWSDVRPYIARAPKAGHVDWGELMNESYGPGGYSPYHMRKIIDAAHSKKYDLLILDNMSDSGGGGAAQTQYAFLNTAGLRAPHAEFNPKKLHLRYPLAGLVGGGVLGYGVVKGDNE